MTVTTGRSKALSLEEAIEEKDWDTWTPLMHAVSTGRLEDVEALLTLGADPNTRDRHGNVPLHKAAIIGDAEKLDALFRHGANVEATNRYGRTALHEAAAIGWNNT